VTTPIHPLDELPPPDLDYPHACVSVRVLLVYADGTTRNGWHDLCSGWMRFGDKHAVNDLDDDDEQPIGWRMLNGNLHSEPA